MDKVQESFMNYADILGEEVEVATEGSTSKLMHPFKYSKAYKNYIIKAIPDYSIMMDTACELAEAELPNESIALYEKIKKGLQDLNIEEDANAGKFDKALVKDFIKQANECIKIVEDHMNAVNIEKVADDEKKKQLLDKAKKF